MKSIFKFFTAAFFTIAFLSSAAGARPLKVHVLDNLEPNESKIALKALSRLGYQPTTSPLFSQADYAVVITKILGEHRTTESFTFEFMEKRAQDALPRTLYELKSPETTIEAMMNHAPRPDRVMSESPMPVAALK